MHLVDHHKIAEVLEFREVKVRRDGDGLTSGDIALQNVAEVRRILRGADRYRVAQGATLGRVAKSSSPFRRRLSRFTIQQRRPTIPASMSRAAAMTGGRFL